MKDMTQQEILAAMDEALAVVAERFKLLREAEAREQELTPLPLQETKSAA